MESDVLLAELLEQLPEHERPRGIAGALVVCDNRLRAQIRELRESIDILESRICDLEATLIRERLA
jgi:polyhydroxyalkanoate synthesis regulator phasin